MTVGVPASLDEALSPEWLSAALADRFPEIRVTAVEPAITAVLLHRLATAAADHAALREL